MGVTWVVEQFYPDQHPWPVGVYALLPTGDDYADIHTHAIGPRHDATQLQAGDWILTNEEGKQYVVRQDDMEEV